MLSFRYIFRLVIAFFQRFKVIIFIALIFGVLIFFVLRNMFDINSHTNQTIGLTGRYTTTSLPVSILSKISLGLTSVNTDGSVVPSIASSWETPDKGKTWVFHINKNLVWHDERSLKSKDLTFNYSDVTVSYPDDYSIEFKLQNNYSAFPYIVSRPLFKKGLLGVSQWSVKKLSLSGNFVERIELIDNKKEKITYRFFPSEERTILAFKLGQVKKISGINDKNSFEKWSKINISENLNFGEYVGVFFNTQNGILGEKNIRQALSYAIDKSVYNDHRALGPISTNSWAYNSQVKSYEYDFEKAKGIIEQFKKDSKTDELTINLQAYPILLPTAEKIANDWEKIGVKTNIQSVTSEPTDDYEALLAIFDTPEDPDQYSMWHSTQESTNLTKYQNPRIDKLLEDGRSEIDINIRKKIYLDFQRFLVEDAPAAFLYYPKTFTISK